MKLGEVKVSDSNIPEGMIPIGEFAKRKGISPDRAIDMVRDGYFVGQKIEGSWYVKRDQLGEEPSRDMSVPTTRDPPSPLSIVFYILAILSALGGFALAAEFWPIQPAYGRPLPVEAYTWSIIWITIGVVQAALLSAIAYGLSLLKEIANNTRRA